MIHTRVRPEAEAIQPSEEVAVPKGRLVFDPEDCRACKVCEVACSIYKEGRARPALARMNITYDEFQLTDPISATLCFQCETPDCMYACPVDAISRDEGTGAVVIDTGECIGCMQCRQACPWDIPKYHCEREIAIKCDLCEDRAEGPACVEACPLSGRALSYEPDCYEE